MKQAIFGFWNEKQGKILQIFLSAIIVAFIGILIGVYLIARNANPVFLDENGKPMPGSTESRQY